MKMISFTKPFLILCEGSDDKAFFSEIIRNLGLEDSFQVHFPQLNDNDSGGKSKFGRFLANVKTQEKFMKKVEAVLVVGDKDDNSTGSLNDIKTQLQEADLPVPDDVLTLTSIDHRPRIAIMMLPLESEAGNLESLLMEAAYSKWREIEVPLNRFIADSPARGWPYHKQSKGRIRCITATTCEQEPSASLFHTWTKFDGTCSIPMDHESFDGIRDFLKNFPAGD